MNMPGHLVDGEGSEWVSNGDGTFRCLSAEIEHMTYNQILTEFGIQGS